VALRVQGETWSYAALDAECDRAALALSSLGVKAGDRVAVWQPKSVRAVAAMQGALRLGAAYVPLDPLSPAPRVRAILADCDVAALVAPAERAEAVLTGDFCGVSCLCTEGAPSAGHPRWRAWDAQPSSVRYKRAVPGMEELAYILYTSGSTGMPKGVCISHRNALAFVEWAAKAVDAQVDDRFSNHAPFHFDLSVFDLYVAFVAGASVALVPEGLSTSAAGLVDFLERERITVWYSVPSALVLMLEHGALLARCAAPRVVVFAGEPFPVRSLRRLRDAWPAARFWNMYGPTETNVCAAYEVTSLAPDRAQPVPIGRAACGDRIWAVKADGTVAGTSEEGELHVAGPTVMLGYWGRPPQGDAPYSTGDLVRLNADGDYEFLGRRDQMVKVRGHRVEPGEIEAALLAHPAVRDAAVVTTGSGLEARLLAFLVCADPAPSLVLLKRHCAERLPYYMIIDKVRYLPALPRTRNGKVDRLRLAQEAGAPVPQTGG
jgi:amino acid adenylation domain-containing protein